jgi:hypothetical protein
METRARGFQPAGATRNPSWRYIVGGAAIAETGPADDECVPSVAAPGRWGSPALAVHGWAAVRRGRGP